MIERINYPGLEILNSMDLYKKKSKVLNWVGKWKNPAFVRIFTSSKTIWQLDNNKHFLRYV
jgi:hypothetical protein